MYSKLHQIYLINETNKGWTTVLLGTTAINMAEYAGLSTIPANELAHMYVLMAITLKQFRFRMFEK